MQNDNLKLKTVNAAVVGAIVAILFISLITPLADLRPEIKNWLKDNFSHHWLGKGILAVAIFVSTAFLSLLFPVDIPEEKLPSRLWRLWAVSAVGAVVIFGFYLYGTFWAGI